MLQLEIHLHCYCALCYFWTVLRVHMCLSALRPTCRSVDVGYFCLCSLVWLLTFLSQQGLTVQPACMFCTPVSITWWSSVLPCPSLCLQHSLCSESVWDGTQIQCPGVIWLGSFFSFLLYSCADCVNLCTVFSHQTECICFSSPP